MLHDRRRSLLVALAPVLGAVGGWLGNQLSPEGGFFGVPAIGFGIPFFIVTLATAWIAVLLDQDSQDELEKQEIHEKFALYQLSQAIQAHWQQEARDLGITEPGRLPMCWELSNLGLSVNEAMAWAQRNLISESPNWAQKPAEMAGEDLQLGEIWLQRTPSRRLVLLGEGGGGKTQLLVNLMSSLSMPGTDPVPILIPISTWDPTEHALLDWLEDWLCVNYRFLSRRAFRSDPVLARLLLAKKRLALIFDGFDELPADHARQAIHRLNTELAKGTPILLASRPSEYGIATTPDDKRAERFDGAVCLRIKPQEPSVVVEYLRARALKADRWAPVKTAVNGQGPLNELFRTPLMVTLADVVYNESQHIGQETDSSSQRGGMPVRDPAELASLATKAEIEKHLLDGFVESRYGLSSARNHGRKWRIADARRWLCSLATDLKLRDPSTDWAWWEMRPRWSTAERQRVMSILTPFIVVLWTGLSSFIVNSSIYGDFGHGSVATIRVAPAALFSYLLILFVTRNARAAVLAATGAYISGVLSGSFDIAMGAALSAGFSWRPLRLVRPVSWLFCCGVGGAAAVASILPVAANAPPLNVGIPNLQGFAAGFADGWVSRWDEVANGALATGVLAALIMYSGAVSAGATGTPAFIPALLRSSVERFRWSCLTRPRATTLAPVAAGGLVLVFTVFADGQRTKDMIGPEWRLAPAEALSVAFAVWLVAHWTRLLRLRSAADATVTPSSVREGSASGRRWAPIAVATVFFLANWLAYATRSDISHDPQRAAADGLSVGILTALALRVSSGSPQGPNRDRPRWHLALGLLARSIPAVAVAVLAGVLDGLSQGWGHGVAQGLTLIIVISFFVGQYAVERKSQKGARSSGSPIWRVDPVEAFVFAAILVGVIASLPYGLAYGLIFGLSSKISREVSRRSRPSLGMLPSHIGILGGMLLGSVIAMSAVFTDMDSTRATAIGLASGTAAAFAFGANGRMAARIVAMSPRSLLAQDRATFLFTTLTVSVAIASAVAMRTAAQSRSGVLAAGAAASTLATYGVTAGIVVAIAQSRHGAYTLTRSWLAARGRLPWRLMTFLDDAHRNKGVLRRNGAVYQFRHEMLQERLARRPEEPPA